MPPLSPARESTEEDEGSSSSTERRKRRRRRAREEEKEEEEKEEEETRALDYTEKERTKRIVLFQTAAETRRRRVRDEAGPFRPLT